MALKAILESLDGISEDIRSHYTEQGGKFHLGVDSVDGMSLEDVRGLKSALSQERKRADEAQALAKAFDGLDADAAREALRKLEDMRNWKPDQKVQEQLRLKEQEIQGKYQSQLDKLKGELDATVKQLEKELITAAASKALAEKGGNPSLLLPLIERATRMRRTDAGQFLAEVLDDGGNTRISPKSGATDAMTIGELIEEMAGKEEFAGAFQGTGARGSGAFGSEGRKPPGSGMTLSPGDLEDVGRYRAAKAAAEKAGQPLVIPDWEQ